jgi:hypothetical protein
VESSSSDSAAAAAAGLLLLLNPNPCGAGVPKAPVGDWWALYVFNLPAVAAAAVLLNPANSLVLLNPNLCCVGVPKAPVPHPDVGDWWALYDYGLEAVAAWPADYQHPYPGVILYTISIIFFIFPLVFLLVFTDCTVGDWWALYDHGLEAVAAWPAGYQHPYPGVN